ncbi:MAG: hypothetical protein JNM98_09200 [Rhodocyclaceae bacterium]|nr:hypothetical protein [Rhodocyclaceae bacterium]
MKFRVLMLGLGLTVLISAQNSALAQSSDDEAAFQSWREQCLSQRRSDCNDSEAFEAETGEPHRVYKKPEVPGSTQPPATTPSTPKATEPGPAAKKK